MRHSKGVAFFLYFHQESKTIVMVQYRYKAMANVDGGHVSAMFNTQAEAEEWVEEKRSEGYSSFYITEIL